jgi:hypothetical protein
MDSHSSLHQKFEGLNIKNVHDSSFNHKSISSSANEGSNPSEWLRVRASCYRRTCRPWCSCRCHIRRNIRTPGLMKQFVGSLFVGYSGLPLFTQTCNETQCQKRSGLRVVVSYQFPKWFWEQALFASILQGTMSGPEMLLRVHRTIPFASETYQYTLDGNVPALRRIFEQGKASPFDMDPNGQSLLHVSVYAYAFRSRIY